MASTRRGDRHTRERVRRTNPIRWATCGTFGVVCDAILATSELAGAGIAEGHGRAGLESIDRVSALDVEQFQRPIPTDNILMIRSRRDHVSRPLPDCQSGPFGAIQPL